MNKYLNYLGIITALLLFASCSNEEKVPIETHFYAPNSFSPNGDGLNEIFYIIPIFGILVDDFHLSIYDQSLNQVHQSDDLYEGWDGKINGTDAPNGYYEYQVIYKASQLLDSNSVDTIYSSYVTSSKVNLFR
jgi:gliding motility-associated-like protein